MSFDTLIPAAFPALALAHFVALLSPGQDFFLITGHAIRHQLRGSWGICFGIALGNALYIAIAILGWTGIRDNPTLFTVIEILGGLYLLWIGWHLLHSRPQDMQLNTTTCDRPAVWKQLILGLNSALLNPKNALFYMSLMTVILGSNVTLAQQAFCGIWMTLVVLFWDVLVAATIGLPHWQAILHRRLHLIERGAGAILISFAVLLFGQTAGLV